MIYKVDATFGILVRVGDKIQKGDKLGIDKNLKDILAQEDGVVKNIVFDGNEHMFLIEVED
ncbi:MAG TPA: hypothetical protein PKW23_02590 [Dictyoglomaceae bacterium]|nr:hypothetical protein [Dictyoglomaceae bacterium]HOL39373.1 hypothetical protein [Dictyoglomaceae bacterium]HOP94812.1 hypothetical protein [Dictyoglomaceae bacterium]HPP15945.1 hypothetical protein [Dictyoglomaceae bacterium]HPU43293.1 hypothetical protein [Dictyoglomaceae bacterium]